MSTTARPTAPGPSRPGTQGSFRGQTEWSSRGYARPASSPRQPVPQGRRQTPSSEPGTRQVAPANRSSAPYQPTSRQTAQGNRVSAPYQPAARQTAQGNRSSAPYQLASRQTAQAQAAPATPAGLTTPAAPAASVPTTVPGPSGFSGRTGLSGPSGPSGSDRPDPRDADQAAPSARTTRSYEPEERQASDEEPDAVSGYPLAGDAVKGGEVLPDSLDPARFGFGHFGAAGRVDSARLDSDGTDRGEDTDLSAVPDLPDPSRDRPGLENSRDGEDFEPLVAEISGSPKRPLRRLLPWAALALVLAFVSFSLARCAGGDGGEVKLGDMAPSSSSRLERVSPESSADYRERLAEYSRRRAEEALESGDSFVAPATGVRERPLEPAPPVAVPRPRIVPVDRPEPKEEARPARERAPRRPVRSEKKERPRLDAMKRYLAAAAAPGVTAPQVGSARTLVLNAPKRVVTPPPVPVAGTLPPTGLPGMRVGDVLPCVNRVALDSDAPGPAMVEVVSGPYRGARAVGSFQRLNAHLVLVFTELATPDGAVHAIRGYAIDPRTDRTAVRSDVDHHTLARWGGLVAASFLEGFGDAASRSGTRSYDSLHSSGTFFPEYSLGDELWIAAGKVGERAAGIVDRNFGIPPTVTLDSGTSMGLLLLKLPEGKSGDARSGTGPARVVPLTRRGQDSPDALPAPAGARGTGTSTGTVTGTATVTAGGGSLSSGSDRGQARYGLRDGGRLRVTP